ncbi:unnamed protein product [Gulo gulo]|uniref:NADH dehydrogenase [ubiquinone] 1 alpha subcomplex subunit 3 n=1 Tax=Gulo gulo TaxID=48420 RepID=A0A9X9LRZ9_GULGU|nr:unnamed protein product [Gulo gulo]
MAGGHTTILRTLIPFTKNTTMINQATPYNYPVPLRDDGDIPDMPRSLVWNG